MNILFVTLENPLLKISSGGQFRSRLMWNAILKVNASGGNFLLTGCSGRNNDKEHENIRYIKFNNRESNNKLLHIIQGGIKRLSGLGILPKVLSNEYNPSCYFQNTKFDFIICHFQGAARRFPYYQIAPLIIDYDDHPLQKWNTLSKNSIPFIIRPVLTFLVLSQFHIIKKHIRCGFLSNSEYLRGFNNKNIHILPNAVQEPSASYQSINPIRKYLFFVGLLSYEANYLGIDRFLDEIWQVFHRLYPNIKFVIAGSGLSDELRRKWSAIEGVSYIGYVENLEDAYKFSIATISPIYGGSGTAIKTRESMIHSRCCLSTSFGARGIERDARINNKGLFLFENADEFIDAFEKISDVKFRESCEHNVYEYAKEHFSPKIFEEALRKMLGTLNESNKQC